LSTFIIVFYCLLFAMCDPLLREASWSLAAPRVHTTLLHGMRAFMHLRYLPTGQHVIWWITRKSASRQITTLVDSPPWAVLNFSAGHAGRAHETWAGVPMPNARARAQELLSRLSLLRPFEFTFVRSPTAHLVSAAAQLVSALKMRSARCARTNNSAVAWRLATAEQVVAMLEVAQQDQLAAPQHLSSDGQPDHPVSSPRGHRRELSCTDAAILRSARHLYPQTSGYGFDPVRGFRRLGFVGRLEEFGPEWVRLLSAVTRQTPASGGWRTKQDLKTHAHLMSGPATTLGGEASLAPPALQFTEVRHFARRSHHSRGRQEQHEGIRGGGEEGRELKRLASRSAVARWLEADVECLGEAAEWSRKGGAGATAAIEVGGASRPARGGECRVVNAAGRGAAGRCERGNVSAVVTQAWTPFAGQPVGVEATFGCSEAGDVVWVRGGCRGFFRCRGSGEGGGVGARETLRAATHTQAPSVRGQEGASDSEAPIWCAGTNTYHGRTYSTTNKPKRFTVLSTTFCACSSALRQV
jgi:hypothetical protein